MEDQKKLLIAVQNERLRCAYYLLLGSGIRLGELLALSWDSVNLEDGVIKIRKTLNRLKNINKDAQSKTALIFQDPKSASSIRDIPISPNIVKELKTHQERQRLEKEAAEGFYEDSNLVFCSNLGTPLDPRNLIRNLHSICKKNGMRRVSVHSLRHSYATRLLEMNQHPKIVQELLGHANISMTLDTYSHIMPSIKVDAVKSLDKLFDSIDNSNKLEGNPE